MLEAQCAAWGGVTSAAIYWPLLLVDGKPAVNADDVHRAKETIQALHKKMDATGASSPSLTGEVTYPAVQRGAPFPWLSDQGCLRRWMSP